MALTSTTKTELYRFFAIAFDAAPGTVYMNQLFDAANSGMTVPQIVEVFTQKEQFTSVYPNFYTSNQFATKLVENVVGSSASDAAKAAAVADIEGALGAGWTRGKVIYQIFTNLANKSFSDPTWGATSKMMANQVTVAQYYTEVLLGSSTDLPTLQSVIASVGATTDVSTPAAIQAIIDASLAGGTHTFTLTSGVDDIVAGSGNDSIEGGTATLTFGDSIDGGAGQDELNLALSGVGGEAEDGFYAGFEVDNVETLNVRAIGWENDVELELTNVAGLETINVLKSTNELYLYDIQNMVDVNLDDVADFVEIDFDDQELLGSADALELSVREVGSSADGDGDVYVDSDLEILNIDDRGEDGFESDFYLTGYGLDEINVAGGEDFTQTAGDQQEHLTLSWIETNGGTSLDSTAFAGDLVAYFDEYNVDEATTGSGDDELYVDSSWSYGNTITTNDGDDSVWVGDYYDYYYDDNVLGGSIFTGNGDDDVHIGDYYYYYEWYDRTGVTETGLIDTGTGADYVEINGDIDADGGDADTTAGTVLLGTGDDHLDVYDGDIAGLVNAGDGNDMIHVFEESYSYYWNGVEDVLYDNPATVTGTVAGGLGNDTLGLYNFVYWGTQEITDDAVITGIETLELTSDDDADWEADQIIDLDAFDSALTTIDIMNIASTSYGDGEQWVELTNLAGEAIKITSQDSDWNDDWSDGWYDYGDDDVELYVEMKDASGTSDSLSVTLYGGSAASPDPFQVSITDTGVPGNEIESLALVNNGVGAREVDMLEFFDKSLTITGNSTSDLFVYDISSATVNGSAYAGDQTIKVAVDQDYSIRTGSGNDVIDLIDDTLESDELDDGGDTINGGSGTDRLIVDESTQEVGDEDTDEVFNNVTSIEELEVRGDDGGTLLVSLDDDAGADGSGIRKLIVNNTEADFDGVDANVALIVGADYDFDLLTIEHNNGSLDIDNVEGADLDIYTDALRGRTLTFTDASQGGYVTVNLLINDGGAATDVGSGEAGAGTDGSVYIDVTAGSIDKIKLLDNDSGIGAGDNGTVTVTVDDAWNTQSAGTLIIDASDITSEDDVANTATGGVIVDGSAETSAKLNVTGSANDDEVYGGAMADTMSLGAGNDYAEGDGGNDNISAGAGNDTVWGDAGNDTIDGGAGNDDITGGLGKDQQTGGAGNDTFYFDAAVESNGLNVETITDFTSAATGNNDTLSFLDTILAGGDIVYLGEVATDLAVLTAMTGAGLSPSGVAEAVFQTTDKLLYVDVDNNGIINDSDFVINLAGVTTLTQADFAVHA